MRSGGRDFLRLCGVALVVGGLAAALTLLFIPLSLPRTSTGVAVGYCGPGLTSDNAVQVRLDPGIVNTGGSPGQAGTAAQQRQFEQLCIAPGGRPADRVRRRRGAGAPDRAAHDRGPRPSG